MRRINCNENERVPDVDRLDRLRLICTDIDGTLLHGEVPDYEGLRRFSCALIKARELYGTRWAVVTGRHRVSFMAVLTILLSVNLVPDYLVLEDALIYEFDRHRGLRSFLFWNFMMRWRRSHLWRRSRKLLGKWQAELARHFPHIEQRSHNTVDLWLEFDDEATAEAGEVVLRDLVGERDEFQVLRWGAELFLAPSAGRKIDAVRKLAGCEGIDLADVFVVGDGANDVNMFEDRELGFRACVGNAPEEIRRITHKNGGYVAESGVVHGVLEALRVACPEVDG
jgi:hydroxymethylpyrimidine pyrophosphatase-like HAD family hydrolase